MLETRVAAKTNRLAAIYEITRNKHFYRVLFSGTLITRKNYGYPWMLEDCNTFTKEQAYQESVISSSEYSMRVIYR